MLLNLNTDPGDHSFCALTYEEADHWLRATWRGFVDPLEAMQGAEAYLLRVEQEPSSFLLNDNLQLQGPWFDSLDWLAEVWVPQAVRLGLRYVAHVVQANQPNDIISSHFPMVLPFELQIFHEVADAQQWLRQCQQLRFEQAS